MHRRILFIASFAIISTAMSCENDKNTAFDYTEYPDYFVVNSYQVENHEEFLIIQDTSAFNCIFHPAATMDDQIWISPDDFNNKVAIGIIKEFNSVCECPELAVKSIELLDKTIVYQYTLTGIENTGDITCDMRCRPNLLILVDRNSFTSVDFYENDTLIKTLNK